MNSFDATFQNLKALERIRHSNEKITDLQVSIDNYLKEIVSSAKIIADHYAKEICERKNHGKYKELAGIFKPEFINKVIFKVPCSQLTVKDLVPFVCNFPGIKCKTLLNVEEGDIYFCHKKKHQDYAKFCNLPICKMDLENSGLKIPVKEKNVPEPKKEKNVPEPKKELTSRKRKVEQDLVEKKENKECEKKPDKRIKNTKQENMTIPNKMPTSQCVYQCPLYHTSCFNSAEHKDPYNETILYCSLHCQIDVDVYNEIQRVISQDIEYPTYLENTLHEMQKILKLDQDIMDMQVVGDSESVKKLYTTRCSLASRFGIGCSLSANPRPAAV